MLVTLRPRESVYFQTVVANNNVSSPWQARLSLLTPLTNFTLKPPFNTGPSSK